MVILPPTPSRLPLLVGLLLLPATGGAQGPPAATGKHRGYVLHLADPGGLLRGPPLVLLSEASAAARRLRPRDDGAGADARAGDRVYTATTEAEFVRPWIRLEVRAGARRWRGLSP